MPLPAGVETVTVSSGAPLTLPDGTPMEGYLTFTGPDLVTIAEDDLILGGPRIVPLVNGAFSVTLVAADATGMSPTGWTYKVTATLSNAPSWIRYISLPKAAPSVVLADIIVPDPVTGSYATLAAPDLFLAKAQNLGDLASPSTARTNLGLGGSAVLGVGTTAGTVAAGNDSRITGAAQKAANLSDLASASAARGNLRVSGPLPVDYGLISWSYPPPATSSSGAGASGVIYFMLVPVPVATTITGVRLFQVSAGATLTAGQCLAGLYDAAGTRVAVSGDQSGAWASGAVVNKDAAFTGPYSAAAGLYWAAMMFNGTSGPVWCKGAPGGMANAGWSGGAPYPAMSSSSGQTSLPASITYSTLGFSGSAFWASIY